MNPYASFLGDRSPLDVIAATPGALTELAKKIGAERMLVNPAPGKWSARDILCHLADCEIGFGFRLRQALAEPNHVVQPFDQEKWSRPYAALDADAALAAFGAVRNWNIALITSLKPQDFALRVTHPERGEMTVQTIVETMGGHDLNHLQQLEKMAA